MENRRPKNNQIGRSKGDERCKKHPQHRQSPGVCSVCLRERLSQLSTGSRSNTTAMASSPSSSSLSSLSSHYSSSELSPVHGRFRMASEAPKGSMSFLRSGKNVLAKSRSMAFVHRAQEGEGRDGKKMKGGFWSKFLRPRSKNTDGGLVALVHSRTMRERVITTRVR